MKYNQMREMSAYVGDLRALFGMKEYRFTEGKARGLRAIDLNNGNGLSLTLLADKCLDIPYLSFRGYNMGFVSKTGVVGPAYYTESGVRGFLKQFDAGFLTTGGITYSGAPCEIDGRQYGLHGIAYDLPAENVNKEIVNFEGQAALHVTGEVREACVFEENMLLRRELLLETETNTLHIHDTVENCGFSKQPVMNVYHMNYGYPMLQKGARVIVNAPHMRPRDAEAEKGVGLYRLIEEPRPDYREQCFFHTFNPGDRDGCAVLYNPALKLAAVNHYNPEQCPILCEWKNMQSGDYALGLEPTACGVMGKETALREGTIRYLEPGQTQNFDFHIEFLDDEKEIARYL